jgi:uncharacterized protein YbaP (TraB family)
MRQCREPRASGTAPFYAPSVARASAEAEGEGGPICGTIVGLMTPGARTRAALLALVALVAAWPAHPRAVATAPFLWEGTRDGHRLALFGTIHVPDERVLRLPRAVQAAFDRADRVVTEVPLDAETQARMAGLLMLPADQRLRAIIGESRFARLEARLRAAVEPKAPLVVPVLLTVLDRLKPWAAMAQLASLDYLPQLLDGAQALDARLYADARAAGKQVGGLETASEQADTFDAFTPDEQVRLLDAALQDVERPGQSPTAAMLVEWYLAGDADRLASALSRSGADDAALARKFETEVLVSRNRRMTDRIESLRRDHPGESLFVAVGALHLVGPDNLPQLLAARGYDIGRVRP